MTEKDYAEKIRSINFGGIKSGKTPPQNDDIAFKKKLERDLTVQLKDGSLSTTSADASADIAGL